jgi:anhydro-N-acetylmuramic acid kinase
VEDRGGSGNGIAMIGAERAGTRLAIGLMSGTSLDGIDAALVESDGESRVETGAFVSTPYDKEMRARLRAALGPVEGTASFEALERDLTERHADVVATLLHESGLSPGDVDVIGFHGQTIFHDPERGRTWQLGDGALLARLTGIDVVNDFRSADMAAGGQGAPFASLYHVALVRSAGLTGPVAVLNVGGVANVTFIGDGEEVLAFDTGPGNAFIDDWVRARTPQPFDESGAIAARGAVDTDVLNELLAASYFRLAPPKSLDRNAFDLAPVADLGLEDGAATLTAFTAGAIARSLEHLPRTPKRWLVTGGGRHNPTLMEGLRQMLGVPVDPVEAVGWRGDALEAEAFAYLAVRSLRGLPLSLPSTTGASRPVTGGKLHPARRSRPRETARSSQST